MSRLTVNKSIDEMSMHELMHNMFYIKNKEAIYRDFEREISCRNLTRILVDIYMIKNEFSSAFFENDETFDEEILYALQSGFEEMGGLIALFYMAAVGAAELREKLKAYEDICEDPEQLKEIDKLYLEKCEEVNTITKFSPRGLDKLYIEKCKEVNELKEYIEEFKRQQEEKF